MSKLETEDIFVLPKKTPCCGVKDYDVEDLTQQQLKTRATIKGFCFFGCGSGFRIHQNGKINISGERYGQMIII